MSAHGAGSETSTLPPIAHLRTDPETRRRLAAEMSIGSVASHIKYSTFPARSRSDATPREAWDDGEAIHYPAAANATVARYHAPSGVILLARQEALVTCVKLSDRPKDEQRYVLEQVRAGDSSE